MGRLRKKRTMSPFFLSDSVMKVSFKMSRTVFFSLMGVWFLAAMCVLIWQKYELVELTSVLIADIIIGIFALGVPVLFAIVTCIEDVE